MAKLDTSRSALLTEDFMALIQTAEDRQAEATERTLDRLYAVRKHQQMKRMTAAAISANAMREAGWR
jgi:hypothetical protein